MKIVSFLISLALIAAAGVQGVQDAEAPLREVVVTYPPSTPRSIIDEAISRISAEVGARQIQTQQQMQISMGED